MLHYPTYILLINFFFSLLFLKYNVFIFSYIKTVYIGELVPLMENLLTHFYTCLLVEPRGTN